MSDESLHRDSTKRGIIHRIKNWLLLEGDRLVIASVVVFAPLALLLIIIGIFGTASLTSNSPVNFLFSSLLTGDLTLITVVLSINQLVLSRELGDPGTLQEQIQKAISYRGDVEETTETAVSPKSPSRFLRFLHENVGSKAQILDKTTANVDDEQVRHRLRSLAESLTQDVETVNQALDGEGNQVFAVVSSTLETNHTDQLQEIAQVQEKYANSLSDEQLEALERLSDYLLQIDVARNYFKTVYIQKEFAYLSRMLLYVGVPAVISSGATLILYNAANSVTVPLELVVTVVTVTFTIGFAPLAILFAFIILLAWIAQQTATVPPFASSSGYQP